jgi:Domain of unknown function (DUF4396)
MSRVVESLAAGHGESLNGSAVRSTAHCLTGCAIGEVLGMVIATALAWGNSASIAISVALAFVFGYALTLGPIPADRRSGHDLHRDDGVDRQRVPPRRARRDGCRPLGRALLVEPCSQPRRRVRDHRSREQVAHRSRSRARGRPAPPLTTYLLRLQAMSSVRYGLVPTPGAQRTSGCDLGSCMPASTYAFTPPQLERRFGTATWGRVPGADPGGRRVRGDRWTQPVVAWRSDQDRGYGMRSGS